MRQSYTVGDPCSVEVLLRSDCPLNPGDRIEFQFPNSWSLVTGPTFTRPFQCTDPAADHYVSVSAPDAVFALHMQQRHLYYPEGSVRHGRLFTADLVSGTIRSGVPIRIRYENTLAPYVAETEKVWLRVNGQPPETDPVLQTLSGPYDSLRVIALSCAKACEYVDVLIVSLDRFDNISSTRFKDERLALMDGSVVAENLDFTGSFRVRVRISHPGLFRFRFRDIVSNAVKVGDTMPGPYWGDIHIHTKLSHDGQGTDPYSYARDISGLDFAGVADHWDSLGPEGYRILTEWAEDAHSPGVFVTILGDERNPHELTGHHNVYFRDRSAMQRHAAISGSIEGVRANSLMRLRDAEPSSLIIVPHHTGIAFGDLPASGRGCAVDWDACEDRGLRPVMEIYSHHGQSELYDPQHLLSYELNRMRNPERRANTSMPGPFYAQDYWMQGKRIGVIASSDEHSGQGGRRHGGLAAVFPDTLTRDGIFDALQQRRCYATTGERILVEFDLDDLVMGESGERAAGDCVAVRLKVWGTDILLRVEIMRYRFGIDPHFMPVMSTAPRPESMDVRVSVEDIVETSCIYYARITQQPIVWPAMAWTSPIWIDVKDPKEQANKPD